MKTHIGFDFLAYRDHKGVQWLPNDAQRVPDEVRRAPDKVQHPPDEVQYAPDELKCARDEAQPAPTNRSVSLTSCSAPEAMRSLRVTECSERVTDWSAPGAKCSLT